MTPGQRPTIDDARRCPLLRHALDLWAVDGLPDDEREAVLDHMAMYDLRRKSTERATRRRALAHLQRLDRAEEALDELRDLLAERERPAWQVAA